MRQMVNLLQASEAILEGMRLKKGLVSACVALGGVINEVLKSPELGSQELSQAVRESLKPFGFRVKEGEFDVMVEGPFGELVVDILPLEDDPYSSIGEFFSKSFFTEAAPVLVGVFSGKEFPGVEDFSKRYLGGMDVSFGAGDLTVGVFVFEDHFNGVRFQESLSRVLERMGCRVEDGDVFQEMMPFESFVPDELLPVLRVYARGDISKRFCAGVSRFLKNHNIKGIEFVVD